MSSKILGKSIVYLLISVWHFSALAQFRTWSQECNKALKSSVEAKLDWHNDKDYLTSFQTSEALGQVKSFFSNRWQTQIYHTATGVPNHLGEAPLVDPEAKAVYIFLHGSGTMKSSGRNFVTNMNSLANLGYAAISLDMPFHAEGPRAKEFNQSNYFMEWLKSIVEEARKSGKPVYLAGHSFGPDVILEFATRYPKLIDGAVALSPAGFNKTLDKWYDNFTSKMKFGGDVPENDAGGIWAALMSKQFLWAKRKLADPTQVNPKLRIRILSGKLEEYVPAPISDSDFLPIGENTYDISVPLSEIFKYATITIESGVGHYLFDHRDEKGNNVVLRELLAVDGKTPEDQKSLFLQTREVFNNHAHAEKIAIKYAQEPLFRAWTDLRFGTGKIVAYNFRKKEAYAKSILDDYIIAEKIREEEIYRHALALKETNPIFYEKNKDYLDKANPKKVDNTIFYPYLYFLQAQLPD
jgi:pimeloyl-ACP methyl ester carboxylesterase